MTTLRQLDGSSEKWPIVYFHVHLVKTQVAPKGCCQVIVADNDCWGRSQCFGPVKVVFVAVIQLSSDRAAVGSVAKLDKYGDHTINEALIHVYYRCKE